MRRGIALALLMALVLIGCGDDDDDTEGGAAAPTTRITADANPADPSGEHGHEGARVNCETGTTAISVVASGNAFDKTCLAVNANQPFTINFDNRDTAQHGFQILEAQNSTNIFFQQAPVRGPQSVTLNVGPLRAGSFAFKCQVHPDRMFGTFIVK